MHHMGLIENVAKEMASEIGSKTREFYEFVLPPIDMRIKDDSIILTADMPGFEKDDVGVTLSGRILHIRACKKREAWLDIKDGYGKGDDDDDTGKIICAQRPSFIDKKIRLPASVYGASRGARAPEARGGVEYDTKSKNSDNKPTPTATYENGILTVVIPIRKKGGISIAVN